MSTEDNTRHNFGPISRLWMHLSIAREYWEIFHRLCCVRRSFKNSQLTVKKIKSSLVPAEEPSQDCFKIDSSISSCVEDWLAPTFSG